MLTLVEVKERLAKQCDEVTLLEYLNVNSNDLVDRFSDVIEQRFDYFRSLVDEEDEGVEIGE